MAGLYYQERGSGAAVVLLHGLFGSAKNLTSLARELQSDYRVISFDLPGHGRSAAGGELSLPSMSQAIWNALDELGVDSVRLVGHSLGGKVAMLMALERPGAVHALVVADIAPVAYPRGHDAIIEALLEVARLQPDSRGSARERLAARIQGEGVVDFLLQSLEKTDEGYRWRMDVAGIARHYDALRVGIAAGEAGRRNPDDIIAPGRYDGPVTFIGGGESDYIQPQHEAQARALFANMRYREIAGAGHWLHAQEPALFARLVRRALR